VAIAVPFIALVVGAIVIMNIMLVSVTERTKEIGLRKSLGARKMDILKQFCLKPFTLATIGGAVGILLAWVVEGCYRDVLPDLSFDLRDSRSTGGFGRDGDHFRNRAGLESGATGSD